MNRPEFSTLNIPQLGETQIALLERLSNACALSGDEGEVRKLIIDEIKPFADELKIDALGNVLATRKARSAAQLKVLCSAHMDEVGFMVVQDEENGFYRFEIIGGIDIRQVPGKPVWIGKDHIPGVIGARPIHLQKKDERKSTLALENLHIDCGEAGKVKPGDRVAFATRFRQIGPSLLGKALDDRLGVATLIELFKNAPDHIEFQAAFTVQEEIGLRGARVAAHAFNPDLAIAIDSTPARDLPAWDESENANYNTRLGEGAAIYIADSSTLSDPRLVKHLQNTGDNYKIKYQFRQPGGGGTDAGAMHRVRTGVPGLSVSVPGRYAHTACMLARYSDWQNTFALLYAALFTISPAIFEEPR
ncbi:MAG: M42 family peptidase [Anaerolineae bacterium]|nr:M42 family peptidase [Anaerolineae bacterium]